MKWEIEPRVHPDLITQLLHNRSISSDQTEAFFNPKLSDFKDQISLDDIQKASERLNFAIKHQEEIIIVADYDADGVDAAATLWRALKPKGAQIKPFVPHRDYHGYGLSKKLIDDILEKHPQTKLFITVDNGITATDEVNYIKEKGLDIIITDHHLPGARKPEADAIVHSTKMCGSAVAWCLIKEMVEEKEAQKLLQFASIGTVCDVLPLQGLGRSFTTEGLAQINQDPYPGIFSLTQRIGLKLGQISSLDLGFRIGPRINAPGRMDSAIPALGLLCMDDEKYIKPLTEKLEKINSQRRLASDKAFHEAKRQVRGDEKIILVSSEQWISGVIGLVAAKLVEEYKVPAIAVSLGEDGVAKGSARSVLGINIVEALRGCEAEFDRMGGHSGAAGFSLPRLKVLGLKTDLQEYFRGVTLPPKDVLKIDAEVSLSDLNLDLYQKLQRFEPFGHFNERFIFTTSELMRLTDLNKTLDGQHLRGRASGIPFIAFSKGHFLKQLAEGQMTYLAFQLSQNRYRGEDRLQLEVKDLKPTLDQLTLL